MIVIQEPVVAASDTMRPFGRPAISGAPRLAVIVCMSGTAWMDVGAAPLTGYSVTAGPGVASVITLSGPYQVSAVKLPGWADWVAVSGC